MNTEQARENMIKQQLRTWEVLDDQLLELLQQVPREDFVPPALRNLAFVDMSIPLDEGQVMMPPKVEARMLQALAIQPNEEVLEVGSGSGYVTALLAKQAKKVYSVEISPHLLQQAGQKLAAHGIKNIVLEQGDAAQGWNTHNMYEVTAITGSLPILPRAFLESMTIGGRLFAIIGDAPVMEATLVTRLGNSDWSHEILFETELPPLKNVQQAERFIL
ncbi:Protein-L-isoaspartate O-methyltransferase [hydrothermal vent metagenome]|uniref:Protein-L-isoaspartate O-methyltransferase n=1 Tax=hydrothermal vent metagenome TaxID=652676 RepID=A0A3B1C374_9ZZZZ